MSEINLLDCSEIDFQDYLKEILSYDPQTGDFTWKDRKRGVKVGGIAGTQNKVGYIYISINQKKHLAHRLVWIYMKGRWPEYEIDHINHVKNDNRHENLREVKNRVEQSRNKTKQSNNVSGYVGVYLDKKKKKWRAQIHISKKHIFLGYFQNKEEAAQARKEAEVKYEFHSNHGKEKPLLVRKRQQKGVYWNKKNRKWLARIFVNGKLKHLGCFQTKEEAILKRIGAEKEKAKKE